MSCTLQSGYRVYKTHWIQFKLLDYMTHCLWENSHLSLLRDLLRLKFYNSHKITSRNYQGNIMSCTEVMPIHMELEQMRLFYKKICFPLDKVLVCQKAVLLSVTFIYISYKLSIGVSQPTTTQNAELSSLSFCIPTVGPMASPCILHTFSLVNPRMGSGQHPLTAGELYIIHNRKNIQLDVGVSPPTFRTCAYLQDLVLPGGQLNAISAYEFWSSMNFEGVTDIQTTDRK